MEKIVEKEKCSGCSACYNICPVDAIKMEKDEMGFLYPIIIKDKCIDCGLCVKSCPANSVIEEKKNIKAYACFNTDEMVRLNSSSGGMFSVLASHILNNGGYVVGAAFDKDFYVEHIMIDSIKDLDKLRGSKYLQSRLGSIFREVKEKLVLKKLVLFTGTPCQIDGLKHYLKKDYDNLYTQDIICHGCPSPKVWNKYLNEEFSGLESVNFRNKDNGWKKYNLKFNNKFIPVNEDRYMHLFLKDLILRESCYNCSSKQKYRNSDILLADLWGAANIVKGMDDDKGLSLMVINTEKGKKLIDECSSKFIFKEINLDDALKYNPVMTKSVNRVDCRDDILLDVDKLTFKELYNKYRVKPKFIERVKLIIKKVLRK